MDQAGYEDLAARLRQVQRDIDRAQRDRQIAAGRRVPRTRREFAILDHSLEVLEQRRQGRADGLAEAEVEQRWPLPYDLQPGFMLPAGEPYRRRRAKRKPTEPS